MFKNRLIQGIIILLSWLAIVMLVHSCKPLPKGLQISSPPLAVQDDALLFLSDLTYSNAANERLYEQTIFDHFLELIDQANTYILIDMFLFNTFTALDDSSYRSLTTEVTQHLLRKKQTTPDIKIDFITDNINHAYHGDRSEELEQLQSAGIQVIYTDMTRLRDSNPLFSSFWRTFIQWWGNSSKPGLLPHPFSKKRQKVSIRTYLTLLNFKANHRKVIVADHNGEWVTMILSANAHDSSSAHSNVATRIRGDFARIVYQSEQAVANLSGTKLHPLPQLPSTNMVPSKERATSIQLLTEGHIRSELIRQINALTKEDQLSIALFYLSERSILTSLIKAARRGVPVRIILDPNKDAFGHEKNGIPNRQSASTLMAKSKGTIQIKWYATDGEQFHTKLIHIQKKNETITILGSANLTGRNIANLNLESSIKITASPVTSFALAVDNYVDRIWTNRDSNVYTVDYATYRDDSGFKKFLAWFQEKTGLSTF